MLGFCCSFYIIVPNEDALLGYGSMVGIMGDRLVGFIGLMLEDDGGLLEGEGVGEGIVLAGPGGDEGMAGGAGGLGIVEGTGLPVGYFF
jgi:hypothetical protein